jgi:cystathionine gamma-lyase
MNDATRVIRAGLPKASQAEAFLPGPVFAAPFHLSGDPAGVLYTYGRLGNPTWTAYEAAITDLEKSAATVVFSSGMAAIAATLGAALKAGDTVLLPSDGYYTGRSLASEVFGKFGVTARTVPTASGIHGESLRGVKLVWLESPSNPNLEVCDIAACARVAHDAGALLAVDNTTPTCLGQQPLALGADFSVSSDTKMTTGHGDLILGHVSVKDASLAETLRSWRKLMGGIAGPMETWLAHRSLATLHVRMERQCKNALTIAQFLASRADVRDVRYPGLAGDPSHAIASRQMKYFGPVLRFALPNRAHAERFLLNSELIYDATSFGSLHTTAERRARWGGDVIEEGFIRLSAGCEDAQDLIADIESALDRCSRL